MSQYQRPDLFAQPGPTLRETDRTIYDNAALIATPVEIDHIVPDPRQPRRAMPSKVRQIWRSGDPRDLPLVLDGWAALAFRETTGESGDSSQQVHALYESIIAGEVHHLPEKPGPLEASMLALVGLAADIRARGGLTNPISIFPSEIEGLWRIETGERRWLAYHLLRHYGYDEFDLIPARAVDFDVWRQASENNQRSNLNAIARARQFAVLLMDLLVSDGMLFADYESFELEQDFYAQVADAETYRIPYGQAETLLNAMGLKGRQSLVDYRALLRLPNNYWVLGDDENWNRDDLLQIARSAVNSADVDKPPASNFEPQPGPAISQIEPQTPTSAPVGQGAGSLEARVIPNEAHPDLGYEEGQTEHPAPVRGRWPRVGDAVLTRAGHMGEVTLIVSPEHVRVKTKYSETLHKVETLGMPRGNEALHQRHAPQPDFDPDEEPVEQGRGGILYEEGTHVDRVIEIARQYALAAIGDSHAELDNAIRGYQGYGGPHEEFGNYHVSLGGGTVQGINFARNQVAVELGDRVFRFKAKRLMDWKLSNSPTEASVQPRSDIDFGEVPGLDAGPLDDLVDAVRRLWWFLNIDDEGNTYSDEGEPEGGDLLDKLDADFDLLTEFYSDLLDRLGVD